MFAAPPHEPLPPPPPHVMEAIVRAERRREKLERLSDLGMDLAQRLAERAAAQAARAAEPGQATARAPGETTAETSAPTPPEPRHDPGRAFAAVSRAVRLTLALEAKIDEEILALLHGEAPGMSPKSHAADAGTPAPPPNAWERRRGQVADCLWDAIEEGMTDQEAADELCVLVQERLMESEAYDELLFQPFRDSVAAICQDLGLSPDWSRWDDEVGFPPETRRTDHRFTHDWARWPSGAKARRLWYIAEKSAGRVRPPP